MQPTSIEGSIDRITYHHPDSGYCVFKLKPEVGDEVTVVGTLAHPQPGESVRVTGGWTTHKEFGQQFKAARIETIFPTTPEQIERYLGSGALKGIGPHFAKKLVATFGTRIFDVLENSPHELSRIRGLGASRIAGMVEKWKEQAIVRGITAFLEEHGAPSARAVRIFKTYGRTALEKIRENPYRLAQEIHGFGFEAADQLALRLGFTPESPLRVRALVAFLLSKHVGEGHCAYPEALVTDEAMEYLRLERKAVQAALDEAIESGVIVRERVTDTICLMLKEMRDFEVAIASRVQALRGAGAREIDSRQAIAKAEKGLRFELDESQRRAIESALTEKFFVLTGGPGTGKTTLTRAIAIALRENHMRLTLCSPTGRAAKRLSECTGQEARTIHRTLGVDRRTGKFVHGPENLLETDFVLVDECSMVDVPLLAELLSAIPDQARVVLVGDADQIPSVGPGRAFSSLLEGGQIPAHRLTTIHRQALTSRIVKVAHELNQGRVPELTTSGESDFYFMNSERAENSVAKIVEMVSARIPAKFGLDAQRDVQVLTPMNRGPLGAIALNAALQQALNPSPSTQVTRQEVRYGVGDRVMITENDYDREVFNGDQGWIRRIDFEEEKLWIDFDGRAVEFDFDDLDRLALAYAITIHKSQGSEFPAVVLPLAMSHRIMLRRNLLYTAVTRGKTLVCIVGEKPAFEYAVTHADQGRRWSGLAGRLR